MVAGRDFLSSVGDCVLCCLVRGDEEEAIVERDEVEISRCLLVGHAGQRHSWLPRLWLSIGCEVPRPHSAMFSTVGER